MNYYDLLKKYIDLIPSNEPIFMEDIKNYFQNLIKHDINQVMKNIYVYLNRMVKNGSLVLFMKGIYYKPLAGVFGNKKLDVNKVIRKKYISDDTGVKGYLSGAFLFNKLGLTTQIPKDVLIMTNKCPNKNDYYNKNLGVVIRRPKIKITDDNFKYLQLLDILNNKDNIPVDMDNVRKIIYQFIREEKLEIDKIFEYAKKTKSKKAIERLYEMG